MSDWAVTVESMEMEANGCEYKALKCNIIYKWQNECCTGCYTEQVYCDPNRSA